MLLNYKITIIISFTISFSKIYRFYFRHGKSALHHAISNVGTSCIDLLIKAGAQLDIGDSLGCTPLWHVACSDGSRHHLECLIAAGASVNICDGREKRIPLQVMSCFDVQNRKNCCFLLVFLKKLIHKKKK